MPDCEHLLTPAIPMPDQEALHSPTTVSGLEFWQWYQQARAAATVAQVPIRELEWLLAATAGLDRLAFRLGTFATRPEISLSLPLDRLEQLWQQRLTDRVPVQYLVGRTQWREFSLIVSPAVLIPRPETELIIDLARSARPTQAARGPDPHSYEHWADLGTGSGAIALGLATVFPDAIIHAVDCSTAALAIARQNAAALSLESQVQFYQGSWLSPLSHLQGQLTGMVSNPPYIPHQIVPTLDPEVARHEPHLALDGGLDGLDCLRLLVNQAPRYLQPGGLWLVEVMAGQAPEVADLLDQNGYYQHIQIHADLAGIDRFVLAFRSDR